MALKDQISALATAVATAINARAKSDLSNVTNNDFSAKAANAGVGGSEKPAVNPFMIMGA